MSVTHVGLKMDGCLAVVCFVYSTAYRYNIYEEFVRRSQVSTSRGGGRDSIPYLYEFTEALEPPTAILRQQRDKARYLRLSRSDRQLSSLPNSQSAQQSIFSFAIDTTQRAPAFFVLPVVASFEFYTEPCLPYRQQPGRTRR